MENVLIVVIALLAAGYLFRKYYLIFTKKDPGCGCGSCSAKNGHGTCSCQSLTMNDGRQQRPDD